MTEEHSTPTLMVAFYAAVTAVEAGQVGEVELEERVTRIDDSGASVDVVTMITVRREVKHFVPAGG